MNNKYIDKTYRKYKRLFQQFEVINKLTSNSLNRMKMEKLFDVYPTNNRKLKYNFIEINFLYQEYEFCFFNKKYVLSNGKIIFCFYKIGLCNIDKHNIECFFNKIRFNFYNKYIYITEYYDSYVIRFEKHNSCNYKIMKELYNLILNFKLEDNIRR